MQDPNRPLFCEVERWHHHLLFSGERSNSSYGFESIQHIRIHGEHYRPLQIVVSLLFFRDDLLLQVQDMPAPCRLFQRLVKYSQCCAILQPRVCCTISGFNSSRWQQVCHSVSRALTVNWKSTHFIRWSIKVCKETSSVKIVCAVCAPTPP